MKWERILNEIKDGKVVTLAQTAANGDARRETLERMIETIKQRKLIAIAMCVLALGGIAFLARPAPAAQDGVAPPEALPAVVAAPVKLAQIAPQMALAGTVVSRNDAHLAADVEGRVAWVADVGTVVKQGDVVARLDESVAAMQLASDKANVARLAAQLRYDRDQALRMQNLFSQSAIAKATRDQAVSTRDMDAAALTQAQAAMDKSQYQHDHDDIRAPFPGRVAQRLINPGEYATMGKDIVRLVDIGSIEVSAQAPIQVSQYIHEGMPVTAMIENRAVPTTVRAIVPVGDQLSRTMEVRLTLRPDAAFVGDAAKVIVPTAAPRLAIAVPRDALLLREDATYLFKLDKANTALRIAVETGAAEGELIEVQGPIAAGDRVIIRGAEHLEAGQKVRVTAAS